MSEYDPIKMHANPLVGEIGKLPDDFQREDLLDIIEKRGVTNIRLRYPACDGRLKELKVPVDSLRQIESVLAEGERVDGSNLYKGTIDPGASDLYVVPIYATAFLDPFSENTLSFICRFFDKRGRPSKETFDNTLARAAASVKEHCGIEPLAMGELEYYLIFDPVEIFPAQPQSLYHEAAPFSKMSAITDEIMLTIARITGSVKYCHSEVGNIVEVFSEKPELDGKRMEQYEVEFLPQPMEKAARDILLAKWVIRSVAMKHGLSATFAPKLDEGDAGSGMHIHLAFTKDGEQQVVDGRGSLSDTSRKVIAGLLKLAPSLTAFGNTVPSAYLRLVAQQEAPTLICWSEGNRSALVRVPLGWQNVGDLSKKANPAQITDFVRGGERQTVEFRVPDGSADVYLLLSALCVAIKTGLTMKDGLKAAQALHVVGNVAHNPKIAAKLKSLPQSCYESAKALEKDRAIYERSGVFSKAAIDFAVKRLYDQHDRYMNKDLTQLSNKDRLREARKIMYRYLHDM